MIYDRQFRSLLSSVLLQELMKGSLPNIPQITALLKKYIDENGPAYKYIPQRQKEVFNNELVNQQLNAISFDLQILYDEVQALIDESLKRIQLSDLQYKVHSAELDKLEHTLNSILFTFKDADQFFLNAFDDFSSYSKTDQDKSTPYIINLQERALELPFIGRSTYRIPQPHLINKKTIPVIIRKPTKDKILEGGVKAHIDGLDFGNIFTDTDRGWVYELTTSNKDGAQIEFQFELTASSKEEIINRIELMGFSSGPQRALVLVSVDNINYRALTGYEDGILLKDQAITYAMDFEDTLTQYIRVLLSKDKPDEELSTGNSFVYRFGLKSFAAYTAGRILTAEYISQPFDFSKDAESITRVSIDAELELPDGTSADFFIQGIDQNNNETDYIPIVPLSVETNKPHNKVIHFHTTRTHSLQFAATSNTFTQAFEFRGITFYKLDPAKYNISPLPIFGTAELFRGIDAWSRDKSSAFDRINVSDTYITFEGSNIEQIYVVTTEIPSTYSPSGSNQVILSLSEAPYYDSSRGHSLKPPISNRNTSSDVMPNYAIYRVEHISAKPRKTFNINVTSKNIVLPVFNFYTTGSQAIDISISSNSISLTPGVDYNIILDPKTKKPTGEIQLTDTGISRHSIVVGGSNPTILIISVTLDPEVTYKVSAVKDRILYLDNMAVDSGDYFKVTYRYVLKAPSELIKSSIRVKDNVSSAGKVNYYVEGTDYVIDVPTSTIQRLPNGRIPLHGHVYVDFSYRSAKSQIETFTTWCRIDNPSGIRILFDTTTDSSNTIVNKLKVDKKAGERFYVNSPEGLIELTKATGTPILGPGWVQFIVRSKNPDANRLPSNTGNLIDQVIQLRDQGGNRIFRSDGRYFDSIMAIREPLKQRTVSHLKVNILKSNHNFFAIDDSQYRGGNGTAYLLLNFQPGSTDELYLYGPTDEVNGAAVPTSIPEQFILKWESKSDSEPINKLRIKCVLNKRGHDLPKNRTPKVYSYTLRAM